MKTLASAADVAPIVRIADVEQVAAPPDDAEGAGALQRARAFAEPLLAPQALDTGENAWAHAEGVAAILRAIGAAPSMQAAAYLVYAADYLHRPDEVIAKSFGASYAALVIATRRLVQIQRAAREAQVGAEQRAQQTERVRKMLLAFSRDLRVVLLRLASRLQTLRWHALSKTACPHALALETQQVFAPLANRLGIWQIKWELEDLAFRFLQPDEYRRIAALLDEKRSERERRLEAFRAQLAAELARAGIAASVQARPKHIYSIWKKMQGKRLDFAQVLDLRALRVLVADVDTCYAVLALVHQRYTPVEGEFDDYIAKPKPNGYQSLHTVVLDDDRRPVEVQIRTHAMHEHAEYGVAAHWAYKEAGARGYAGVSAAGAFEERVAEARKAVLRQLLAWERDYAQAAGDADGGVFDDRIYVFTPQAAVVELPAGATPVDFAYSLHTELGHRCRGARVDGQMVPLNTPLANGQTVEIVAAKEGGPSLDWLNPELGYLASSRAKSKVRAWFNALAQQQTIARGREAVEKLLQREGRTALKLDDLAAQLGFNSAAALFEVVGKDEYSLRHIEQLLRPPEPAPAADEGIALKRPRAAEGGTRGGVLVVGVDSLLTSLARCCRPAPPDAIGGFVTRGRGVAVHRADCPNFRHVAARSPQRVIPVEWGAPRCAQEALYPVDVLVEAADRPGLLRDISEVFAKEKMNVTGVHTQSVKDGRGGTAWMTFTVEVTDASRLQQVLGHVMRVGGVRQARRR
ncbi:bifunctional (p)ppGpp synthetase/guanosine-3',5'-bis(diphosphate) 3'-pyrophosphohydrolase [Calidifontimicrobium sp. SYSU G02091]|uniref:RelA/SpoT family protein n=1 Tax=Calidifontimicrobium sp. SYSU G02091 TaxID=2926421 RepID=UPI001F5318FC|nr:bifunctional (p)ppGpp synthetase/guanosine-3',5'-bis(diphosphate) 3'-pyrophosphohydrolase [Calidifontimicrobium sp. SYSU G02091]MCI1191039.1 bifunctional (p)ppGpp synthetase/guanosine-3',5'-bis(diphosphate) 3'-pyrophosphohydrolase [Calidifontimicrobium sp. SYSU G02091]